MRRKKKVETAPSSITIRQFKTIQSKRAAFGVGAIGLLLSASLMPSCYFDWDEIEYQGACEGNGCPISCLEGWHLAEDSTCVVDCPSPTVTQQDGSCAVQCDEFEEAQTEFRLDVSETETLTAQYCEPQCPWGMVDNNGECDLPCGEGWSVGDDGKCHLDCPAGMSATTEGARCAFDEVGERKVCPETTWDTAIAGPAPLFVDPTAGSENGDGTQEAPFATISQAVAAMGDEATVYLAAGIYDEQVIVEDKKRFNLIGQCATTVTIAPSTMTTEAPDWESYVEAGVITTHHVDNIRIHGVRVQSGTGGAVYINHDTFGDTPESVEVDEIIVDKSADTGVRLRGAYDTVSITDSSFTEGQNGIDLWLSSGDSAVVEGSALPYGDVTIQGNTIDGILVEGTNIDARGVSVMYANSVTLLENSVSNLENALGVEIHFVNAVDLERNIITHLMGGAGITVLGPMSQSVVCDATVLDNILYDIRTVPCTSSECYNTASGIFFGSPDALLPVNATVTRNRFELVQGHAVDNGGGEDLYAEEERAAVVVGGSMDIVNSEFIMSSGGIYWANGDLNVTGCRFSRMWSVLFGWSAGYSVEALGGVSLSNNLFEDREVDPAGSGDTAELFSVSYIFWVYDSEYNSIWRNEWIGGNIFKNNRVSSEELGLPLLYVSGGEPTVEDNLFMENDRAVALFVEGGLSASNNVFASNLLGLLLSSPLDSRSRSTSITDNYFFSNKRGLDISFSEGYDSLTITDNVFLDTSVLAGLAYGEQTEAQVDFSENYFGATTLQLGAPAISHDEESNEVDLGLMGAKETLVKDNLFEESRLFVAGRQEETTAEISGNLFNRSHLDVYQVRSELLIENNGFYGPSSFDAYKGTGIGVYESFGPVQIKNNVIRGHKRRSGSEPGPGIIGDGIHVVGASSEETTEVEVTSNLIEGCERYGMFLFNASGSIDGNMFLDNGTDAADDVVILESQMSNYQGADLDFITPLVTMSEYIAPEIIEGSQLPPL